MNISYEEYYKLVMYTDIDLKDESYLNDTERLKRIINNIKIKNPKKYIKKEDHFENIKKLVEYNEEIIFLKYILKELKISPDYKCIESYFCYLSTFENYLNNFGLSIEKIKEIHLKYLDSFDDKSNYKTIVNFLNNYPDFLTINDELTKNIPDFDNLIGGITYNIFNHNFVTINNCCNDYLLQIYCHEMQHVIDLETKNIDNQGIYYELKPILGELYISDFICENYDKELGLNSKYFSLLNQLFLIIEMITLSDILSRLLTNKNDITYITYLECLKEYKEEEITSVLEQITSDDFFIHSYNSIVSCNIYFNNKDKNEGYKIADNYINNSLFFDINMDINFKEVLKELINEINNTIIELNNITSKNPRKVRK